jgi:hypothetical protein
MEIEVDKTIEMIISIRNDATEEMNKDIPDGNKLSTQQYLLSVHLGDLGGAIAPLTTEVEMTKTKIKLDEIDEYLKVRNSGVKMSVDDAKAMAKKMVGIDTLKCQEKEGQLAKLKAAYENTKSVIIAIQVKLNYLKSERINSSLEGK